jgi:mannose-6-phosphate isomerase-like protein (cupin superfamily)
MGVRCVVTGQNGAGKSVVMRDSDVEAVTVGLLPGYEFYRVWGCDSAPRLPSDGTAPAQPRYFPPRDGFRFAVFVVPPGMTRVAEQFDMGAVEEMQAKLPGLLDVVEMDHPGMHTTDTVDFDVIVSGEVFLELDDGAEVLLRAGDCVIQNGTRHAWHNRSAEKCVIAVTLLGAERRRGL